MTLLALFLSMMTTHDTPASPALTTPWTDRVDRQAPWPEYPRPQLVRKTWLNLNGTWDYAIRPAGDATPVDWDGAILVPFPVESSISGVGRSVGTEECVWYRRKIQVPSDWDGSRIHLHFGAVDWETRVWIDDRLVGVHQGGFDPFSFDITSWVRPGGEHTITVKVNDPTDDGPQPRGKQTRRPHGIWYTAVTGIWQTVWLEATPKTYIAHLRIEPNLAGRRLSVRAEIAHAQPNDEIQIVIREGGATAGEARGPVHRVLQHRFLGSVRPWRPDDPFLYDLEIRVLRDGSVVDSVESYVGMRDVGMRQDANGHWRLTLNGQPIFHLGLLDQGWWPDGLYTAPTDEALVFDIDVTKRMGFNTIRKHVKVEPARWYYHCDRLGVLVWQDMPHGFQPGVPTGAGDSHHAVYSREAREIHHRELRRMVDSLISHPSIVMWVPFNEGWGQMETSPATAWLKAYDPSRLVNAASGWDDHGVGDVRDIHAYPGPARPVPDGKRALVLGEFGGLGRPIAWHLWQTSDNWGYRTYDSVEALATAYEDLFAQLPFLRSRGLAAAIYTQTTDVEIEVNGLLTYDRRQQKIPLARLADIHRRALGPMPLLRVLLPTSEEEGQLWRYTTNEPAPGWNRLDFIDNGWASGPGVLGRTGTPGVIVRTEWTTSDLWVRRTFNLPLDTFDGVALLVHHDEDARIYLNGVLAAELTGFVTDYRLVRISEASRRALRRGTNVIAAHVHNTVGGQSIDIGLVRVDD